ncbi:MAG: hypothetical protein IH602_17310 [Bryobacteraceae bacterium]|nr:hypothetical protein [Bryobacteraceae bacterium]
MRALLVFSPREYTDVLETLIWYLNTAAAVLVAIKFLAAGLGRFYPVLAVFLVSLPARSLLLMGLQANQYLYSWVYIITSPMLSLLTVWAGLEIYRLVLEAYSGLSALGRRSFVATVAAGGAIAFLTVQLGLQVPNEPYPTLRLFLLLDSWISGVVLFFLITLTVFVLWFPVPLRRNVAVYSFGLCAKLAAACTGIAVRVFAGSDYGTMGGVLIMAADTLVCTVWLFAFTRSGERTLSEGTIRRSPEQRARLLSQLNSLNAMARSVKPL